MIKVVVKKGKYRKILDSKNGGQRGNANFPIGRYKDNDRPSVLYRDSWDVSDHHEGILRFRPRLLSRRSILVLPSGMFARRLWNDTIPASRMAGPVLQTLHYYFPSCRVIIHDK